MSAIKINIKDFIYKFYEGLCKNYVSYILYYTQTYNIFNKKNNMTYIFNYAIQRFVTIYDNFSSSEHKILLFLFVFISIKLSKLSVVKYTYSDKY